MPKPTAKKLRLFVLAKHTLKPLAGIPVRLTLAVESHNEGEMQITVGTLASDHMGYLSFDLPSDSKKHSYDVLQHIWIDPLLDEELRTDLITPYKMDGGTAAHPITLDKERLPEKFGSRSLPSIPNPDVIDWKQSPGSFGMNDMPIIGEGGCETLMLSSVTEQVFKFHQLVRLPSLEVSTMPHIDDYGDEFDEETQPPLEYRRGKLFHYEVNWQPINHGLGKVLYSLTLAPCESVNLAVIDWIRQERTEREEETGIDEHLAHDQRRDRVIEETVEATLHEWQSGESFMGGTAGTGGYGGGGYGQMWGVTGSHSLGYSTASGEGRREVGADTIQKLADRIRQASSLSRNLRSTVVVQASQAEREQFETRTVTNHNHGHALSVLYYEVVRHYCICTELVSSQDVLFIRYDTTEFTAASALEHANILRPNLLDTRFDDAFSLLDRSFTSELKELDMLRHGTITKLLVRVTMGSEERTDSRGDALELGAIPRLRLLLMKSDGTIGFQGFDASNASHFPGDQPFSRSDPASPTINTRVFDMSAATSTSGLTLGDLNELGLAFDVQGSPGFEARFRFIRMEIKAVVEWTDEEGTMHTKLVDALSANEMPYFMNDTEWWAVPDQIPDVDALHTDLIADKERVDALLDHLNAEAHNIHYNILLWMHENPNRRAQRFEDYVYSDDIDGDGDTEIGRLTEFIHNTPLGVFGNYVAFAAGAVQPVTDDEVSTERIVSMPTRGAFAEAKLSHCNANEVIDETRFWDWQQSPCGSEAPAITGISPQARSRGASSSPSALPATGIGIEQPAEAPAPVGLSEVMELLRTPDIFRDLSGLEELRPLLETLVEVAGEVEKARIAQLDAGYERPEDRNGASGGGGGPNQNRNRIGTPASRSAAQETLGKAQAMNQAIRRAVNGGLITEEQGNALMRRTLSGLAGNSQSQDSLVDEPGVENLLNRAGTRDEGSRIRIDRGNESFEYDSIQRYFDEAGPDIQPVSWWDDTNRVASFEQLEVCTPFQSSYEDFRRSVIENSSEIRTGMIYRSDREYPEEVIDRRPDLQNIHEGFADAGVEEGQTVCLLSYIVRDERGYVMLIRFTTRDVHMFPEEPVEGELSTEELITNSVAHARRVAETITEEHPRQRLLCILSLADRLGPEQAMDLFTLNPLAVSLFIDMSEIRKEAELSRGLPPDSYKMYPIRNIAFLIYYQAQYRENDSRFREALLELDRSIYQSVWLFVNALRSGSSLYGDNFYRLRDWLRIQQENSQSIYSCYGGVSSTRVL